MTEMVDRVARIMHPEAFAFGIDAEQKRPAAFASARRVIEAMRTPTPGMLAYLQMNTEIGAYVCENWSGGYDVMEAYQSALIDAALGIKLLNDEQEPWPRIVPVNKTRIHAGSPLAYLASKQQP